jgi:protein-disulfide isomerase/uncharacterized membrane protein
MQLDPPRLAIAGALLGAAASAYLLVDYTFGSGICLTGSGCDLVRASELAYPFGLPMPLFGLAFYLVAVALALAAPTRRVLGAPLPVVMVAWASVGVAVMAVLTAIELFVIGAVCSWCLVSAVASVLLGIGAVGIWRRSRRSSDEPVPRSARARRRAVEEADRRGRGVTTFALRTAAVLGVCLVTLLIAPPLIAGPAGRADTASAERPRLGNGPVEVVVYSDFQCPACAATAPILSELAQEGSVTVVYRYFPLRQIHANADAAAAAAHAAALQGRFWEFHDALFARQPEWAQLSVPDATEFFAAVADDVGLDVPAWRSAAASDAVAAVIAEDVGSAESLRLSGTPTIFIGGERYSGPLSAEALAAAVAGADAER